MPYHALVRSECATGTVNTGQGRVCRAYLMAGFRHMHHCSFIQLNEISADCDRRLHWRDCGLFQG